MDYKKWTKDISNLATNFITGILGESLRKFYKYEPTGCDIIVDDNFNLAELGFEAYILHTPGYSTGSLSIIIDNGIAIVGDAMFGVIRSSVFPPYAEDTITMIKSWKKLLDTGCSLFIPGHGTENSRELLQKEYEKYAIKYGLLCFS